MKLKKLFLTLLTLSLLPAVVFAQVQRLTPPTFGWTPYTDNGGTTSDNLSLGTTWQARGFMLSDARTLNTVRIYCSAKTGTPLAADIHVMLYPSNTTGGGPGATATEDRTLAVDPVCPGWIETTGFSTALTARTQYYIVIKNTHGTPASNYVTIVRIQQQTDEYLSGYGGNGSSWGWNWRQTTDSGTTWAGGNSSGDWAGIRLGFSDSSYAGLPLFEMNEDAAEASGTKELGVKFVVPADGPGLRVRAVSMINNWNGTPPTQFRYRLYTGASATPTLLGTTGVIEDENITQNAGNWIPAYFSAAQLIPAGTTVRLVAGTPSGGSAGNAWTINRFKGDTDANSLPLYSYANSLTTTADGTTFTETAGTLVPFALILDTLDPYDIAAAGGGTSNTSTFNQSLN